MDIHRVSNHNQMDYNFDNMEPKHGKMGPCPDDRFDSGLDSLKEDELVNEFEDMTVNVSEDLTQEYEPWRTAVTEDGDTLLHLAIIHEATDHALQMIKLSHNHPFLNVQNHQRQTALHLAVITEQPQLVERLLKAGLDPLLADDSGNTALHIACKKGSLTCFGVITQNSQRHLTSIMSFPNYNGHNCLHLASINGYISLVENLVQLGADINAQEQCSGRTSLHLAVDLQNPTLVRCLVDSRSQDVSAAPRTSSSSLLTESSTSSPVAQPRRKPPPPPSQPAPILNSAPAPTAAPQPHVFYSASPYPPIPPRTGQPFPNVSSGYPNHFLSQYPPALPQRPSPRMAPQPGFIMQ